MMRVAIRNEDVSGKARISVFEHFAAKGLLVISEVIPLGVLADRVIAGTREVALPGISPVGTNEIRLNGGIFQRSFALEDSKIVERKAMPAKQGDLIRQPVAIEYGKGALERCHGQR